MGRSPCCSKVGLRRGAWSTEEDTLLSDYIHQNGEARQWRSLSQNAGLSRCGKSCRLRWVNYLRPGIKRGNISEDEEDLIVRMHGLLGNRWSLIAGRLPGRTDNEIKNHWKTHLLKKLQSPGIHTSSSKDYPKKRKIKKEAPPPDLKSKIENGVDGKTKVYLPKPIRVSSLSSSDGAAENVAWPPTGSVSGDGKTKVYLPKPTGSVSGDAKMLELVYDEYFELLFSY